MSAHSLLRDHNPVQLIAASVALAIGFFLFFPQVWWATYSRVAEYEDDPSVGKNGPPTDESRFESRLAPARLSTGAKYGADGGMTRQKLVDLLAQGAGSHVQRMQASKARYRAKDPENPHIVHLITPEDDAYYQDLSQDEVELRDDGSGGDGAGDAVSEELPDMDLQEDAEEADAEGTDTDAEDDKGEDEDKEDEDKEGEDREDADEEDADAEDADGEDADEEDADEEGADEEDADEEGADEEDAEGEETGVAQR